MNETQSYICESPERLDTFLTSQIGQSRSQIAQLIKKESVFVDGKIVSRSGVKLKENQVVLVKFPPAESIPALDVDFDVEILYEDDDILVINKPTGLTVHPAPSVKEATLVDWLKHKGVRLSSISGEERHGIVHRLDKGTSGAMVIAKNNTSHEFLSNQLQDKSMGRYYLAVVNPPLKEDLSEVIAPIARSTHNRLKMAILGHGKYARSAFKVLALSDDEKNQFVACKLYTGRTHQIRVHLESLNRHIIGDHIYAQSPKQEKSERILLHAYIIYFIHPKSKEKISFVASLDKEMKEYLDKKFNMEKIDEIMDVNNVMHGFDTTN
ncbi:MAG: RluA family pseudouridine synthase [Sulfurimonas sp.]|jgi:23S rRNA pseudouridine1911/1915/1917 synthase|uniref:RluA family pseudouridine synthase n=1 Tax=Sulfurimonas sp. TaxID=2022749 RepID=UPI0026196D8E|nr:RluA family pseudouridine synthase [Sulfurimonas sp.]MDD3477154.1 RluA family pseudouridine synthase [Sulfurimonas sp.]